MSKLEVPNLPAGTVHLWEVDLDENSSAEALSDEERARAARFRFDLHRNRFVAGRLALRRLIGGYLGMDPGAVAFKYSAAGKPSVSNSNLAFNLAHSEARGLIGFALSNCIGVDVEEIRPIEDMRMVAQHSFSENEFARWDRVEGPDRVLAFYRCWTRKEAFLKATGEGIAHRLKSFDVSFESGIPPRILSGVNGNWAFRDVSAEPHYAAAVACEGGPFTVEWKIYR